MRRLLLQLLLLVLLLSLSPRQGESQEAKPKADKKKDERDKVSLVLNTGGHTTPVAGMAFTPNGKHLITAERHEVHVWAIPSGELEYTWRLPLWIQRIAIAPDGRTLAVVGNLAGDLVWILDIPTRQTRTFKVEGSHYDVESLMFSQDGKRLAWAMWYGAGVINLKGGPKTNDRINHQIAHPGWTYTAQFDREGENLLVCGGRKGNQAVVYSVKREPGLQKITEPKLELKDTSDHPLRVVMAPDNSRFVGWSEKLGGRLRLWSADGKVEKNKKDKDLTIPLPGAGYVQHLQFISADRVVAVATGTGTFQAHVVDVKNHKVERSTQEWPWPSPGNLEPAVSADGKYLALTGSQGFEVRLYDLETNRRLRNVGQSFAIPGSVQWGADNRSLVWHFPRDDRDRAVPSGGLNLSTLRPLSGAEIKACPTPATVKGYKAIFEDADKRKAKTRGITILREGKRVETAFTSPLRDHQFFKDGKGKTLLAALGQWGNKPLALIDPESGEVHSIQEHSHGTSLAVSPDGQFLALTSESQAVNVYRLEGNRTPVLLRILVAGPDWVVWTRSGFFAATPNGERLIGWANRTDRETPLTFYPAERFRKQLYRPELIKQILSRGGETRAMTATQTPEVQVPALLPPKSELVLVEQNKDRVKLRAVAAPLNGKPVEAMRLILDGASFPDASAYREFQPREEPRVEWVVNLPPGEHELKVLVRGSDSVDVSNTIPIQVPTPLNQLPTLYCLGIGIDYRWDPKLDQSVGWLTAPPNDVRSILQSLEKHCSGENNRFGKFVGIPLINQAATRQGVLDAIRKIRQEGAKPGDLMVLFYAGHGVTEGGEFYLLTADLDPNAITTTCLTGAKLRQALQDVPCQRLLLLDACQSGQALANFTPATDEVARSMTSPETAVTVIAAAMAYENAQEKGDSGRFTLAINETLALRPGAVFDTERKIMRVDHLHVRVRDIVSTATEGKQHPTMFVPFTRPPLILRKIP